MIELRYKVETWIELTEFGKDIKHTEPPQLQQRDKIDENTATEWQDVPTEYVEV